jgi:16S rRNA (adenine1518-N6/adenine1519-N6)-dimethyltransferase
VSQPLRSLLKRHGLHLSRELGQNFLVDPSIAEALAVHAGVSSDDTVIEVGTGLGALTRALAARAKHVVTLEIDSGLVRVLREETLLPGNVELVHADALDYDLAQHIDGAAGPVRLVANLPYSVATPLLRRLIDLRDRLADWSVMLQSELASRIVAAPGSKDYGSFAVLHQLTVDAAVQQELAPGCFFPVPGVRSSFVRIWPRATPLLEAGELPDVERIVRMAFAQRRKTLINCLLAGGLVPRAERARIEEVLAKLGIDPGVRAEKLPPKQLLALSRALLRLVA